MRRVEEMKPICCWKSHFLLFSVASSNIVVRHFPSSCNKFDIREIHENRKRKIIH